MGKYEAYIRRWHFFLKGVQEIVKNTENDGIIKSLNMYLLNQFYVEIYDVTAEFYPQFEQRLEAAKEIVKSYH